MADESATVPDVSASIPIRRSIYLSIRSSYPGTARSQEVSEIDKLDDERQQLRIEQSKSLDQLNDTKVKLQKVREELQDLRKTRDGLNDTVRASSRPGTGFEIRRARSSRLFENFSRR